MLYQAVYKCKLCGEKFSGCFGGKETLKKDILMSLCGEYSQVHLDYIHYCDNGGVGVGELIGIEERK